MMGKRMKKTEFVLLGCLLAAALGRAQSTASQYSLAGNNLYAQKNYDQAIRYYKAALNADASNWQAFQGLGNCYYAKGDKAQALSNYQQSLNLHPDNPGLSSFTDSLRAQSNATSQPTPMAHQTEAERKSFQQSFSRSDEHFELGPTLALVINETSGLGFGLGGDGFYMLDANWGLGGLAHLYVSSDSSISATVLELVPAVKFKFGGRALNPYLVGGFGLAVVSATSESNGPDFGTTAAGAYPVFDLGVGIEFHFLPDVNLFGEARIDEVLAPGASASYYPLEVGAIFNQL